MRNRLLSLLVAFAILLSLVPTAGAAAGSDQTAGVSALAAADQSYTLGNGVELKYNDSGAITGCTLNGQDTVEIPNTIDGVTITSIERLAFQNCSELVSVTIPDTVTSVGEVAFSGCTSLQAVHLSNALQTIGDNAFSQCGSLTGMTLPDTLKTIGNYAFSECKTFETLGIPDGVTAIGEGAFFNCSSLTEMTIPVNVTEIKTNLFSGCTNLASVTISEDVTAIGDNAFHSSGITRINIPQSVAEIGHNAFNECRQLKSVSITGPVTAIKDGTFVNCEALAAVELPSTVTSIGESAFENCSALQSVTGTGNVTSIGNSAFKACGKLATLDISNASTIGTNAFQYCTSLDGIQLSESLSAINAYAFDGCTALTAIVIPDSVGRIGNYAFQTCNHLMSLTIGTGVSNIGSNAFAHNDALTEVNIPANVSVVNNGAFFPCNALRSVRINNRNMTFYGDPFVQSDTLVMYGYAGSTAEQYAQGHNITFANIEGRDLSVTVTDPDGTPIESGFTVNWYGPSGTVAFTGTPFSNADAGATYTVEVVLDETLANQYVQPQRVTVTPSDPDNVTVQLAAIERVTVTGTVKDAEGKALAGATVTASTGEKMTTGSDGTFSLAVKKDTASLTVRLDGYYSRVLNLDLSEASGSYDAGEIVMTKTVTDRIVLNITKTQAAETGKENVSKSVPSAETFTITVARGGTGITGFEVQGNSLIFEPNTVNAGDTLTVTVTDPTGEYISGTATVALDANKTATANVELVQRGSFILGTLSGPEASLLVFNGDGKQVYVGTAAAETVYPAMEAGAYTLVLIQRSNVLRSVPSLAYLGTLGLAENTDYVKTTVTVSNGVVSRVEGVTVPELDESRITYTLAEGTSVSTSKSGGLVQGGLFMLRLAYELDSAKGKTAKSLKAVLPAGVEVPEPRTVIIGGKTVTPAYDEASRTLTIPVTGVSAVANVYCKAGNELGMYVINGYLEFNDGSEQPIGSTAVTVENSGIMAPETTSEKSVVVSGTTSPNSAVTVYDNDVVVGTATSNAAGSWAVSVTLAEPTYNYSYHFLRASITNGTLTEPILTDETLVTYDERTAQLTKITMINTDDFGERTTVYDFTNQTTVQPYYLYAPRFPSFTFKAEFSGNAALSSVYIFSEDSFGVRTYIPTTYDAANNCWVGSHDFENDPPCRIGAVYETDLSEIPEVPQRAEDLDEAQQELVDELTEKMTGTMADAFKIENLTSDGDTVTASVTYTDPATNDETDLGSFTAKITKNYNDTAESLTDQGYEALNDELLNIPEENRGKIFLRPDSDKLEAVDLANHLKITVEIQPPEPHLLRMSTYDLGTEAVGGAVKCILGLGIAAIIAGAAGLALAAGVSALLVTAAVLSVDLIKAMCEASVEQARITKSLKLHALGNYDRLNSEIGQLVNAIAAKCSDGSPRLDAITMREYELQCSILRYEVDEYYTDCVSLAEEAARDVGGETFIASFASFGISSELVSGALSAIMGMASTAASKAQAKMDADYNRLSNEISRYVGQIQRLYKDCDKQPEPDPTGDESPALKTPHGMDPSGYVYEAVPSNRLAGVTAVISSKGSDGSAVQWDAGTFDQVNPQVTGADGMYRWDVPEGSWRVDFTKAGYEDADTTTVSAAADGWLPVPPPQLEINIPMVSTAAPKVELATAYTDPAQAEIVFSQYMDIDSVEAALTLTRDGEKVEVEIVPLDAEAESDAEDAKEFATRFAIRPKDNKVDGELKVSVTTGAENYAGTALTADYTSGAVSAETARPTEIKAAESFQTAPGKTAGVKLTLGVPGLALKFESLTPSIAKPDREGTVTDENGEATLHVTGLLPGTALIKVTEPVSGVSVTVKVIVSADGIVPEPVTVTLENGTTVTDGMTVPGGSRLVLKTATEGAEIRYTLDGACPCGSDAKTYTAPFAITGDVVLRAASVVDGVYSSTIRLSLRLGTATSGGGFASGSGVTVESSENGSVTVRPESPRTGDKVTVTVKPNSGYDLGKLTVTDRNGKAVEATDNGDGTFTFTQPNGFVTVKAEFVKCPSYAFPDLDETKWYHQYTDYVLSNGLMRGTDRGLFDPDGAVTRAQMVTVLWNMAGNGVVNYPMTYSDVSEDAWYAEAIRWATSEGIAGGYGDGVFGPDDLISREQMATMLYRYEKKLGSGGFTGEWMYLLPFTDTGKISEWAFEAVAWCNMEGILQGKENGVFDPSGTAKRAEMAAVLERYFEKK